MTNPKLYMMTVRITLLCTMVFFSSGFTTIVKYCSMSQSSECCCCESDHSENAAAQTHEPSVSDQIPSCLTIKVIGGLNEIKAPAASEVSTKLLAVETIPLNFEAVPLSPPAHSLSFAYADDSAPPDDDICIRISSLLI